MKIERFLMILMSAVFLLTPLAVHAMSFPCASQAKFSPCAAQARFTPFAAQARQDQLPPWGGMVTFTFDDGNQNIYENALPVFQKYGLVGTLSPIVGAIEDQEDWIVTWPQLLEFSKSGWEIGSHTMTHPFLTTLSNRELDYELGYSKKLLARHGIEAKTVIFPYSNCDPRVLDYAMRYYENARTFESVEPNGIDCDRYGILCREVSAVTQPDEVIAWIKDAVAKKKWLVLVLHQIVPGTPGDYQYNAGDLEKIVAFVADQGIPAPTVAQALSIRQASLGPNLIKNPDLDYWEFSGWGRFWARYWHRNNPSQVVLEWSTVRRVFSEKFRLKIMGGSGQNMAYPEMITLPDNQRPYLLSFCAEVATEGENGGIGICIDEFDADGNWLNYRWLGGFYWYSLGMPGYIYQPSSPEVAQVAIYIFSDPNAQVDFWGDNFFFGMIK